LSVFTAMLGLGIISPIVPLYAESLGATFVEIGLLSSAWSISRFIFTPPIGRLSDTRSKKKIIAAGLVIYMAVSILYSLAASFTTLLSIRILHGIGSAMSMPIALAYAAELAPKGREGRYMGTMNLATFSGMGMGPLIGGSLTDIYSMDAPFYFMAFLSALSLLLTLKFLPDERKSRAEAVSRPSFRKVLSKRILRAAFIYRFVGALGRGSIFGFLALYISGPLESGGLGEPVTIAGLIISVSMVSTALLQRPFGDVADRFNKVLLILLGGVISFSGYFILPLVPTVFWALLANIIVSLGDAISMPSLTAMVTIEGRDLGIGTTVSVLEGAMSAGLVVGPLIAGILIEIFSLSAIFYFGGLAILAGTSLFFTMQKLG